MVGKAIIVTWVAITIASLTLVEGRRVVVAVIVIIWVVMVAVFNGGDL